MIESSGVTAACLSLDMGRCWTQGRRCGVLLAQALRILHQQVVIIGEGRSAVAPRLWSLPAVLLGPAAESR